MVIADEESKYLWDFFDKSKLEGVDLQHLQLLRYCMCMETMMKNMIVSHQKVVFALMIKFMNLKACEF